MCQALGQRSIRAIIKLKDIIRFIISYCLVQLNEKYLDIFKTIHVNIYNSKYKKLVLGDLFEISI